MPRQLKHVVDSSDVRAVTGTKTGITIAEGQLNPDRVTTAFFIDEGSKVGSINYFIDVGADNLNAVATAWWFALDWYIGFQGVRDTDADMPQPGLVGFAPLRSSVFHEDQGISGVNAFPTIQSTFQQKNLGFRGVLKIPRAYGVLNDGDRLRLFFASNFNRGINADTEWVIKTKFIWYENEA